MNGYVKEMRALVGHRPLYVPAAVVLLLNREGKILLQRRADDGKWGIPGAAMEPGDSYEVAVTAGHAVFWESGEWHETRTDEGLVAIVIESETIEPETFMQEVEVGSQEADESLQDSDPHAEGFYLKMGAVRIGEIVSTVFPGRMLPLMRVSM